MAITALLLGGTTAPSQAEESRPQVNGHELASAEWANLRWLADKTYPRLAGDRSDRLETLSVVSWWALKEGVLTLPQESPDLGTEPSVHDFNLCTVEVADGFEDHRYGPVDTCAPGMAWQVGISGIQPPNVTVEQAEATATELYPGQSADEVLRHTLAYAGYSPDSEVARTVLADQGDLRKSWLVRNHGVGVTLQEQLVRDECMAAESSWCHSASWEPSSFYAPDAAASERARADLTDLLADLTQGTDDGSEPSEPDTVSAQVWDLGGTDLNVRAEPDVESASVAKLQTGDAVEIACQIEGPEITNDVEGLTSTLWDYLPAQDGYVADAWIHTGTNDRVAPDCSGSEPPSDEPPSDEPPADESGPAVTGIAEPCSLDHPYPADESTEAIVAGIEEHWGLVLQSADKSWTDDSRRDILRIFWETLDAVDCTEFLDTVRDKNGGSLAVRAGTPVYGGWADYGLTQPGALTIDPDEQQAGIDRGIEENVAQNLIHELGHAYSNDRRDDAPAEHPSYYANYVGIHGEQGGMSRYGNTSQSENFADVLGFYVARCAPEAFETGGELLPNPYDGGFGDYYAYARDVVFGGKEFGPAPGSAATC